MLPSHIHTNFIRDSIVPAQSSSPSGITPAQMRQAYGANQVMFGSVVGNGSGQTIAIVDAYNQPDIASDLTAFDNYFDLPAPPSLTVVNQNGATSPLPQNAGNSGWGIEISLDVEWAHVIAPGASILLVEANAASDDLYTAVDAARNHAGVSAVSMSWSNDEASNDSSYDYHFTTPTNHTGVTFLAASGDDGAYSTGNYFNNPPVIVQYPAASPNVVGVGATTLNIDGSGNYQSEQGWGNGTNSYYDGGSGGGISQYASQPSYQQGVVTQSSTQRTVPDVSMDGDPNSGVPIYDSYDNGSSTPWATYGGTSLATPMYAGVIAIANQGRVLNGLGTLDGPSQTLPKLYALPSSDIHDVTSGNNYYAAGPGYDLVTGRGTPIMNLLDNGLASAGATIGGFSVNPTTVSPGTPITLTASNVTESGATITGVNFYRESNGTSGLQIGSDTLVGAGTQNGTTWTLANVSTAGLSAGTYTFYAVASDSNGNTSSASSTTLTVVVPTIGGFTVSPTLAPAGTPITLTATNVSETGGTIAAVNFYRESNGTSGLQIGSDTLVGAATQNGTTWTLSNVSTTGLAPGTYTFYAVATDGAGNNGSASSATLTVDIPTIGGFAVSPTTAPTGTSVTLTATNVAEAGGALAAVDFYLESNGASGLQIGSDTLVGAGTQNGTTWSLSGISTTGLAPGTYTFYAVATDSLGNNSSVSSATLTLVVPTIGTFTVSPSTVTPTTPVNLTATNVAETGGTIAAVNFYLESNGTSGLQIGSDTLVGAATQSGTTWSLSNVSTTGLAPGIYTFYAVATDAIGNSSSVSAATLTITNSFFTGELLAWNVAGQSNYGTQDLLATTIGPGITNSLGLTRGSGVSTSGSAATNAWGGRNWASTSSDGISGNEYASFGLTVSAGEVVSLTTIDMNYRRGSQGPANGLWQYQLNGSAWTNITDVSDEFPSTSGTGGSISPISLSGITALQNISAGSVLDIRVVPYGASSSNGPWYVYDLSGDDLVLDGTVAAAQTATTTAITSNTPNPSTAGQLVAFNVSVSGGVPDGEAVTLEDASNGNAIVGTGTLTSGTATINVSSLSVGTHDILAVYSGDASYSGSQSSQVVQTVNAISTATALVDNGPNPATAGQAVSFAVTVSPTVPDGESVSLEDASNGNAVIGTGTLTSGTATINVSSLPVGTHDIFAVYGGDANAATSESSQVVQTVNFATITTVSTDQAGPYDASSSLTFAATITGDPSVGTVTFYAGPGLTNQIGSPIAVINGMADSTLGQTFPAGSNTVTAIYSGGSGFAGSQGTDTFEVSAPPPTIANVVINQNIPTLYSGAGQPTAGVQRSMVEDIVYTFSEPVNIASPAVDPNVFTVAVASGWTGTAPATLEWSAVAGTDDTQWEVDFGGASIANGAYAITVNHPASITAASDGQALSLTADGVGGATQSFYRLFGDINGDEFVNASDNLQFKQALTTYNAAFDFNQDGFVNAADNIQFKNDLSVNFSGFTPTI